MGACDMNIDYLLHISCIVFSFSLPNKKKIEGRGYENGTIKISLIFEIITHF
jgi:hypothetical protein